MYLQYNILCHLLQEKMKGYNMKIEDFTNEFNLWERAMIKIHIKLFTKFYNKVRIRLLSMYQKY